jgi:glutamyl-tRNA synthetase
MEKDVLYFALENAIKFNGKANPGAVIGKILSSNQKAKDDMKETSKLVNRLVSDVNKLTLKEQEALFLEMTPSEKKPEKKKRGMFEFLKIPEGTEVRSAFPPGPEKYPHIGHAKACLLNYMLAEEYNGEFILRFEDTNPELVKAEFYDIMLENLSWLGVRWAELHYASDHMAEFLKDAETLIKNEKAYMCSCSSEHIKESRMKSVPCKCRKKSAAENLKEWKQFPDMDEGKAILRLKIDLEHRNSTMRDPAIFRTIKTSHARHGTKYKVWPMYDFQTSVMDGINKITHRMRSKEFEMRNELQRWIQAELGYPETQIYEFARFNMTGVLSSGREIREQIQHGNLLGWDDPSLTTIVALRRRGFLPEAIKNFVVSTGMTKSESTLTWDDLIIQNKRLLDRSSDRYFFVDNPVKISIKKAPNLMVELKKHPELDEKGYRKFSTNTDFYISKKDHDEIKDGEVWRLMDCLNFTKKGEEFMFDSVEHEHFKKRGKKIIHWLPADEKNIPVTILMPDKRTVEGIAEKDAANVKEGQVIQFERFGFCRLDNKKEMVFWFTH